MWFIELNKCLTCVQQVWNLYSFCQLMIFVESTCSFPTKEAPSQPVNNVLNLINLRISFSKHVSVTWITELHPYFPSCWPFSFIFHYGIIDFISIG